MQILEGIFYTNLTIDLTQYIAEIKQKETINEYTIFIIFYNNSYNYYKYLKSRDCILLNIDGIYPDILSFSNGKHSYRKTLCDNTIDEFKKMCDDYDLLEKYVKFEYSNSHWYALYDSDLYFYFWNGNRKPILFKCKNLSINEFIEEILTNYPEFYKYDYSQIKPAIEILAI